MSASSIAFEYCQRLIHRISDNQKSRRSQRAKASGSMRHGQAPICEALENRVLLSGDLAVAYVDDSWAALTIGVDPDADGPATAYGTDAFATIQEAIDNLQSDGTIHVADGTYNENLSITQNLTLLSDNGRDVTFINGISGAGALGAITISNTTSGVQIGDINQGFTILGIDNGNAGVENAAIYLQGSHTGMSIIGNEIIANGEHGLNSEYSAAITDTVVSNNIFSGQTFVGANPGSEGFGSQFTTPNVPRQLVNFGGGSGSNNNHISFTNNQITGTAGGLNDLGKEQGNTLVTIDAQNSTITGNTFAGTTTRYGAALRVRGSGNATVTDNTFVSTNMGDNTSMLETSIYRINSWDVINDYTIDHNNFDGGAYLKDGTSITTGIESIIENAPNFATVNVLPGTYHADITITQDGLKINGPNYEIAPDSVLRGAEAIITGGFRIQGNVTWINGLTVLDGVGPDGIGDITAFHLANGTIGTRIANTIITGSDVAGSRGIVASADASLEVLTNDISGWATGIYLNPNEIGDMAGIHDNKIHDNNVGLSADNSAGTVNVYMNFFDDNAFEHIGLGAPATTVNVLFNSFDANSPSVSNYGGAEVNASYNWWGTTDLALIASNLTANATGPVDYSPILNDGIDINPDNFGFDASGTNLTAHTQGSQTTGIITEALNLQGPGSQVNLDGDYTGDVIVGNGIVIGGDFTLDGTLTLIDGATLAPGNSPAIVNTGDLTMGAGETLAIELFGRYAGSGYDQVNVTGSVDITDATLDLSLEYWPSWTNKQFVIINNDSTDAVVGTFDGLAEGATLIDNGVMFTITYQGGDGNDVVLLLDQDQLSVNYVDDDWAGIPVGTDPDGAGPAGIMGFNAFAVPTLTNVAPDGTLYILPGYYDGGHQYARPMTLQGSFAFEGGTGGGLGFMISPGYDGPGTITVQDIIMHSDATMIIDINGTQAGTEYDQFQITMPSSWSYAVYLDNPTLQLNLGYYPKPGDQFTIIDDLGPSTVNGRFSGLAEGATISAQYNGVEFDFTISYVGGDGNDVVITTDAYAITDVYVDDDWASLTIGDDPDGAGPIQALGFDAFTNIQEAINTVDAGGTVHIAAGDYDQGTITVNKNNLTLIGAQNGVDARTRDNVDVTDETVIHGSILVNANVDGTTLDGLFMQDFNEVATEVFAVYVSNHAANTTVQNVYFQGTDPSNVQSAIVTSIAGTTNNVFTQNVYDSTYYGVYLNPNAVGNQVTDSLITNTRIGYVIDTAQNTTVTGNTFDSSTGIYFWDGGTAGVGDNTDVAVASNTFQNGTGVRDSYVTVDDAGFVVDLSNNTFDGKLPSAMSLDELYALEDVITHAIDDPTMGLASVVANNLYVTQASGSIQNGIDAATAGDTLHVQAGTFTENLTVDKALQIHGAGSGATILEAGSAIGINLSVGGSSAAEADRLHINGMTINNAASMGIYTNSTISYITIDDVDVNVAGVKRTDYALEIGGNGDVTDLIITNSNFSTNYEGAGMHVEGNLDGLTITDSHFDGNNIGFYGFQVNGSNSILDHVNISDTSFSDNTYKGLYIEKLSNALFDNITVINSGTKSGTTDGLAGYEVWPTGIDLNLKFGDYSNITIQNSNIINSGSADPTNGVGLAVKTRDDAGYAVNPATLDGLTITGNVITGGQTNVRFGEPGRDNTGITNAILTLNDLSGSLHDLAIDNQTSDILNAPGNWYGTTNRVVIRALLTDPVNASPYLASGIDIDSFTPGFQPELSTVYAYVSYIHIYDLGIFDNLFANAINLANENGQVIVNPVVASEPITVGKNITLSGNFATSSITMESGTTLSPGYDYDITSNIGANDILLSAGSTFAVDINSTSISNFDHIQAYSTIDITDAILEVSLNYAPTAGDSYKIIDQPNSNPIVGNFAGLAEGDSITATYNGVDYDLIISYVGGDGNDITLTAASNFDVIYVDDDWAGTANGDDPDAGGPAGLFGYNAFATISQAIAAVNDGGTIYVNDGTYTQALTINKSMSLLGANAGVDPTNGGVRSAESTITNNVTILADDVVFNGFELSGYNYNGLTIGGKVSNVAVSYNYIHDSIGGNSAILLAPDAGSTLTGDVVALTNIDITNNYIVTNSSINNQVGIRFSGPAYTHDVQYNHVTLDSNEITGTGVGHYGIFSGANPAGYSMTDAVVTNNYIHDVASGINLGNMYNGLVNGNIIDGTSGTGTSLGVINGSITNNTYLNIGSQLASGGTAAIGIWGTEYGFTATTNATISGNVIHFNDNALATVSGIYTREGADSDNIHVNENSFINGLAVGNAFAVANWSLDGGTLDASNNWWSTTDASEVQALGTDSYEEETSPGVFETFTSGKVDTSPFLESGTDFDGGTAGFQGDFTALTVHTQGDQTTGLIQEGIDDVDATGIVHVDSGTYVENININKYADIIGTGSGNVTLDANSARGFNFTAGGDSNVNRMDIDGFTIINASNGLYTDSTVSFITIDDVTVHNSSSYGFEVHNNALITDMVIDNSSFSTGGVSVGMRVRGSVDGLTITNSNFDNNSQGFISVAGNDTFLNNVDITDSTFSKNTLKGIYLEKLNNGTFDHITIDQSGTAGNSSAGFDINLKYDDFANITIQNSTISNSGTGDLVNGVGLAVKARDDGSYASNPATLDGVTITNNFFTDNQTNLRFGEPGKDNAGPTNVVVFENSITGSITGVELNNQTQADINASNNWWGSTDENTVTASIIGTVDFSPYLESGTDTDLIANGFQGDFSALTVTDEGSQTTNLIFEGIDTVDVHGTVHVAAGTYNTNSTHIWYDPYDNIPIVEYTEYLNVNKSVSVLGANAGVNPNTGTRGDETTILGSIVIASYNVNMDGFELTGDVDAYEQTDVVGKIYLASGASNTTLQNLYIHDVDFGGVPAITDEVVILRSVSGTTIIDNQIDGGIYFYHNSLSNNSVGTWSSTLIQNNTIGSIRSGNLYDNYSWYYNFSNLDIVDNHIGGIYLRSLNGALINNNTISSGVSVTGYGTISNNDFTNGAGLTLGLNDSLKQNAAASFYVTGNFFTYNSGGNAAIYVEREASAGSNHINFNSFTDGGVGSNANAVVNHDGYGGILDLSNNWWDTTDINEIVELTFNPWVFEDTPGVFITLSEGFVDTSPFLESGTDTDLATPGFQGDFSALTVHQSGAQTNSNINEALNSVDPNGTVHVLNGTYTENVTIGNGVTLAGSFDLDGTLSLINGAQLLPGNSPGIVSTTGLTLAAGTTLGVELDGATAGTEYDQVDVTGTVDITDATLDTFLNFLPTAGEAFTIINNDGSDAVVGTFAGLAEGTTFILTDSISGEDVEFTISYTGGDGNDVVLSTNNAPSANAVALNATEDSPAVNGNFDGTDPDITDTLTYVIVDSPAMGSVINNNDGTFSFTPGDFPNLNNGETKDVTFTYKTIDSHGVESGIATVTVTVSGVNETSTGTNHYPNVGVDSVDTQSDVALDINVILDDIDPDGDTLHVHSVDMFSEKGVPLTINADGTIHYDPTGYFDGYSVGQVVQDAFKYVVQDPYGYGDRNFEIVFVTVVDNINDAPAAQNVSGSAVEDGSAITLNFNADDVDTDDTPATLTYSIVDSPAFGNIVNNGNGTFTFTPGDFPALNFGQSTNVTFTYKATDSHGADSNTATVTITITGQNEDVSGNDAPVALNVSGSVSEDGPASTFGFNADDVDLDDDSTTLTYTILSTPANGILINNGDGTFSFNPNGDFEALTLGQSQNVVFTYKATDSHTADSNVATVTITINGANEVTPPTNHYPNVGVDSAFTEADTPININVLDNDTDADGDTLSVYGLITAVSDNGAALTINADGTIHYDPTGHFDHLNPGEFQQDSFRYTVTDPYGYKDTNLVIVTVSGVDSSVLNIAPVAENVEGNVSEDATGLTLSFIGSDVDDLLANLTFNITSSPAAGSVVNNGNGTFTFAPGADFQALNNGETDTVTFTYEVIDPHAATSNTATITITVIGADEGGSTNTAPIANQVSKGAQEDGPSVTYSFNADDADGDDTPATLTYTVLSSPSEGSVINNHNGTFTFAPGSAFQDLGVGKTRSVTFTYKTTDSHGADSNTATVTITVTGKNDYPTGVPNLTSTQSSTAIDINVLGNDFDRDGDTLQTQSVNAFSAQGVPLTINADGTIHYDPTGHFDSLAPGSTIRDTFRYYMTDPYGYQDQALVFVDVTAPVVTATTSGSGATTFAGLDPSSIPNMVGGLMGHGTPVSSSSIGNLALAWASNQASLKPATPPMRLQSNITLHGSDDNDDQQNPLKLTVVSEDTLEISSEA